MAVISIDHVVKHYKGAARPAVNNLTLNIESGEIYGLLGPNGAGKSTTVMMICGLIKPDQGSVSIMGLDPVTKGAIIRSKVGVATQEIALFPSLTGMENLNYLSRIYGIRPDNKNLKSLLERFGLDDQSKTLVASYSGGMKRRLNLIASILHKPEILILDEPTAGVDVQSRSLILSYLQELNRFGVTIIYSSHILEEAERLCHTVGILWQGSLTEEGPVQGLLQKFDSKSLEEVYLNISGKRADS